MLAESIDSRKIDLSHLQFFTNHSPVTNPEIEKSPPRYLRAGIAISIFCHVLFLLINWELDAVPLTQPSATILVVQLKQQLATHEWKSVPEVTSLQEPTLETVPALPTPTKPIDDKPKVSVKKLSTDPSLSKENRQSPDVIIKTLTPEEFKEIVESAPTGTQSSFAGISANVFNPALRKRLQDEEVRPVLQRANVGLKTLTDPSGATIVDLEEGKCLRASAPKSGEAQNWYMTFCGGKSESEQIMDKINEEVKARFQ